MSHESVCFEISFIFGKRIVIKALYLYHAVLTVKAKD